MLFRKNKGDRIMKQKICRRGGVKITTGLEKWIYKNNYRERSPVEQVFLLSPMSRKNFFGKASLCTLREKIQRASLAVETAFILPIFFLAMVAMISLMDLYKIQTEHLTELCENAKKAGMYAYRSDGGGSEEIVLPDVYFYQPVSGIVPLPKIWIHNSVKVHAWTGVEEREMRSSVLDERMVYVTENGNAFHRNLGCSYLNMSLIQMAGSAVLSAVNDYGEKYTACEICSRNQRPAVSVYLTKKGNRYHNQEGCSGLKRTVKMIKESVALEKYHACSRCG